ncbi:DNA internalization-related competence protein ComEC/Rec2 [Alteromonas sp. CYL-A6]|uniref:DNA internalization-related competence protein ComEC/Rec2 n=1 Tax=Alteromonas nitratireducens TaxID=3390813 RepID=UPI0034B0FF55
MGTQAQQYHITIWLLGFCSASLTFVLWPSLPSRSRLLLLSVVLAVMVIKRRCLALAIARRRWRSLSLTPALCCGVMTGVLWMASVGHWYYAWQLPADKIKQPVTISGQIVSAACKTAYADYYFQLTSLNNTPAGAGRYLRLYDHHSRCLPAGAVITASARLTPAYGSANPFGFLSQQYYASRGIVASGSLEHVTVLRHTASLRDQLSQHVRTYQIASERWLNALLFGERSQLTRDDWTLLQDTGTGHLFSISGFHLGIVALILLPVSGAIITLVMLLVCRGHPVRNARPLVLLMLLVGAGGYVILSGAQLPAVRAWLLLAVVSLFHVLLRQWPHASQALLMMALLIVLFPLSLLSASFYLSAGAVLLIWYANWRWQLSAYSGLGALWRLQLMLSVALLPLTLGWFSVWSVSGVVINLVLVPWLFVLLPAVLVLLGMSLVSPESFWPMQLADVMMGGTVDVLRYLRDMLPPSLEAALPVPVLLTSALALWMLSIPGGRYRRRSAAILVLPLLGSFVPADESTWYLHVLDAGQGTAMVLARGQHAIVIDTGASSRGVDRVMTPALLPLIAHYRLDIDAVVVSHGDNDHAGGVPALIHYLKNTNQLPAWYLPQSGCVRGHHIEWQKLSLRFLWPTPSATGTENNLSCVLQISDGRHSILLPGDIERSAEYALLTMDDDLTSSVLIAPHHGSNTSSTGIWIQRVAPEHVIFTQQFAHRWGFPHDEVVSRYREQGTALWATSEHGYLRVAVRQDGTLMLRSFRHDLHRRWFLPAMPLLKSD